MSGLAINAIGSPRMFAAPMGGFETGGAANIQSTSGGSSGVDNPLIGGGNEGITGTMGNLSQFMSNLINGINDGFAAMSNALLGGGGDFNQLILRNARLKAALGYARTFWQSLMQELEEEKKALASQKSLGTAG